MVNRFEELQELLTLAGDPVATGLPEEWEAAELRLGRHFPTDYRDFVSRYGYCSIGDLRILNPFSENGGFWQDLEMERASDAADLEVDDPDDPLSSFPRPKGMIPWGSTGDGGSCLWIAGSGDADQWTVFETWELAGAAFAGSMTDFLVATLRRAHASVALGPGFPSSRPCVVSPIPPPKPARAPATGRERRNRAARSGPTVILPVSALERLGRLDVPELEEQGHWIEVIAPDDVPGMWNLDFSGWPPETRPVTERPDMYVALHSNYGGLSMMFLDADGNLVGGGAGMTGGPDTGYTFYWTADVAYAAAVYLRVEVMKD